MRKRIPIVGISAFLILGVFSGMASAQDYPSRPAGYVSDFARKLTNSERDRLNGELKGLDDRTTNEVMVVTVNSLQGQDIATYARGLFQEWRVGKRGKSNGVLLLWAPNERKVRIEVGDGLKTVLTSERADRIMDDEILPQFRANKMSQGVLNGTRAIIRSVDKVVAQAPPPAAPRTPTPATPQPNAAQAPNGGQSSSNALTWVIAGAGLFVGIALVWFLSMKTAGTRNREKLAECRQRFDQLHGKYDRATDELKEIKKAYPRETWQEADRCFSDADIKSTIALMGDVEQTCGKGLFSAGEAKSALKRLDADVTGWESRTKTISKLLDDIEAAKKNVPVLIEEVAKKIEIVRPEVSHEDVSDPTRADLAKAEDLFQQAKTAAGQKANTVNWLDAQDSLAGAQLNLGRAKNGALIEKGDAVKARAGLESLRQEYSEIADAVGQRNVFEATRQAFNSANRQYQEVVAQMKTPAAIGWSKIYASLESVRKELIVCRNRANDDRAAMERVLAEVPQLLQDLPTALRVTESHVAVSVKGHELLAKARGKYDEARRLADTGHFNWIYVHGCLKEAEEFRLRAEKQRDDELAEERRQRELADERRREAEERRRSDDGFVTGMVAGAILSDLSRSDDQPTHHRHHSDPVADDTPTIPDVPSGGGGETDGTGSTGEY